MSDFRTLAPHLGGWGWKNPNEGLGGANIHLGGWGVKLMGGGNIQMGGWG